MAGYEVLFGIRNRIRTLCRRPERNRAGDSKHRGVSLVVSRCRLVGGGQSPAVSLAIDYSARTAECFGCIERGAYMCLVLHSLRPPLRCLL